MHARAWVVRRTAEEGALASFDDTPHPTHRAGVQEEPEPFALVPAHAQLLTCCDFDAAGTRLLCGDAAGQAVHRPACSVRGNPTEDTKRDLRR